MASKTKYETALLQSRADKLAQEVIDALRNTGIALSEESEISCEYLGVSSEEGFDIGSKLSSKSAQGFQCCYRDGTVEVPRIQTIVAIILWYVASSFLNSGRLPSSAKLFQEATGGV